MALIMVSSATAIPLTNSTTIQNTNKNQNIETKNTGFIESYEDLWNYLKNNAEELFEKTEQEHQKIFDELSNFEEFQEILNTDLQSDDNFIKYMHSDEFNDIVNYIESENNIFYTQFYLNKKYELFNNEEFYNYIYDEENGFQTYLENYYNYIGKEYEKPEFKSETYYEHCQKILKFGIGGVLYLTAALGIFMIGTTISPIYILYHSIYHIIHYGKIYTDDLFFKWVAWELMVLLGSVTWPLWIGTFARELIREVIDLILWDIRMWIIRKIFPFANINKKTSITGVNTLSAEDTKGGPEPFQYYWDFDYDGQTFTTDAEGKKAYPDLYYKGKNKKSGTYTIALRIKNDAGWTTDMQDNELITTQFTYSKTKSKITSFKQIILEKLNILNQLINRIIQQRLPN